MKKAFKLLSLLIALTLFAIFTLGSAAEAVFAKGIDVSYWQSYYKGVYKQIDFDAVKADGNDFVIMRIGTSYGPDSTFNTNYQNAKKAGLDVGCYFYTYAKTSEESLKDAKSVVEWLGNRKFEYPVYFDIEDSSLESLSKSEKMAICDSFVSYVSQAGYLVGIYCNPNWLKNHLDTEYVKANYDIWLANWTNSGEPDVDKSADCRMWQYSAKGVVSGISGEVDMDVSYFDYPSYIKDNGLNNYPAPSQSDPDPDDPDPSTGEPETGNNDDLKFEEQISILKKIMKIVLEVVKKIASLLN